MTTLSASMNEDCLAVSPTTTLVGLSNCTTDGVISAPVSLRHTVGRPESSMYAIAE